MTEGEQPEGRPDAPAPQGADAPKHPGGRPKGRKDRKSSSRKTRSAENSARYVRRILQRECDIIIPFEGNALTLLQIVYKDPRQPGEARIRAASMALPFEMPRLATIEHSGAIGVLSHEEALAQLKRGKRPTIIDGELLPSLA